MLHEVSRGVMGSVDSTLMCRGSYDLDLDKRLSEETTVLVENYTVRADASRVCSSVTDEGTSSCSSQMDV